MGNGYTVQLSPTISTVVAIDISPEYAGKTCTLALHMPSFSVQAVNVRNPGGISITRLTNNIPDNLNAQNVGVGSLLGIVSSIQPVHRYNFASGPCEVSRRGYQLDSIDGLDMIWFQMTYPAVGLFMLVT
jgi:glucan endo-1,3-beta-D-glucosidase